MFDPDKWAEEADKKLAQKLDVDARKDAAFLAKRELLNAQAPQFWDNLRKVLQTMCEAYNKRKKFDPVPNDTVKIRCTDGHDELLGKYDSGSASVRLESVRGSFVESYSAKVIPNHEGHVVLIKQGHGVISVEDIATRALNYLLGL